MYFQYSFIRLSAGFPLLYHRRQLMLNSNFGLPLMQTGRRSCYVTPPPRIATGTGTAIAS